MSEDFFIPLLSNSITYDRGVGFFSSGWLRMNSVGMTAFAGGGGIARWITSPILGEEDWLALKRGDEAKQNELLREILRNNIEDLRVSLETDTLSALSWMLADGILDFKIAVLRGKLDGDFHDKFGILTDAGNNKISFNGSNNESIQGSRNYESFKIFKSWIPSQTDWVTDDVNRFNRLWDNRDLNVRVLDIGDSNKEAIIRLRTGTRPYNVNQKRENGDEGRKNLTLRPYQNIAIEKWFEKNCRGFFEMATGTGKTITALAATQQLLSREKKLAVVVAVPYQHLVDQWIDEATKFGFKSIKAYKTKGSWINRLNKEIVEYNNGYRDFVCVITTHTTFADNDFQSSIARIQGVSVLIADEAHHLGTETAQRSYPQNIPYRLALSATPNRWYDDEGTLALREYFGETVFEFPLKDAIGVSLTRYYYYPVLVDLEEDELELYEEYSNKIARLSGSKKPDFEERLKMLLLKRADILNKARGKLTAIDELITAHPIEKHTLFYCAPGQLDDLIYLVGNQRGFLIHSFTSEEEVDERKTLLHDFATGKLQALAAIKCLDEGVDVPNTETAYLLASTSNPREFIQRRGRILRKAEGKEYSYLYDLITVPPISSLFEKNDSIFNIERNIVRKELSRLKEFAEHSQNKHHAIDVIWKIAKRYHLMDF